MSSFAIRAENLGKRYRVGTAAARHDSLRDAMMHALKSPLRNLRQLQRLTTFGGDDEADIVWALRDVSFEVREGEVLGIIGRNGAGKSTLLKILSRITEPSTGRARLWGRVGSLLEVGTGFHQELTGRENVYLNGSILGMDHGYIERKFDEIVAFAEVERFIDTPVKRYSSGMYLRLAFAVAAHLEPEILIVDEVLAVGDSQFQAKCLGRMGEVAKEGRTVLFVSHNMQAVASLCDRGLFLKNGRVDVVADVQTAVSRYLDDNPAGEETVSWTGDVGDENLHLRRTRLVGGTGGVFRTDEPIRAQVVCDVQRPMHGLVCMVEVWSDKHQMLAISAYDDAEAPPAPEIRPGRFAWELTIPANTLGSGTYELRFNLSLDSRKVIVYGPGSLRFAMENIAGVGRRFPYGDGLVRADWPWRKLAAEEVEIHEDPDTLRDARLVATTP